MFKRWFRNFMNDFLEGFKAAGCMVSEDEDIIKINAPKLKPFIYKLERKSLGATVNPGFSPDNCLMSKKQ